MGAAVILSGAIVGFWPEAESARLALKPATPRLSESWKEKSPEFVSGTPQAPAINLAFETSQSQGAISGTEPSISQQQILSSDLGDPLPETSYAQAPSTPGAVITTPGDRGLIQSHGARPGKPGAAVAENTAQPATQMEASPSSLPAVAAASRIAPGLSYEDELFRTKWGWAAWEDLGRALRAEEQTTH